MKKQNFLFSAIAALALVIFSFSGCDTVLSEGKPDAASRSVGTVQADLTGQTYLLEQLNPGVYGVSRIDFTSPTTATGQFGNTSHKFEYNLVSPSVNQYSLTETGTPYSWTFNLNGNNLTFTGPFKPYSDQAETFVRIFFLTQQDLSDLTGTRWLGLGPRGASLLDQVVYSTITSSGSLQGTFGPDKPSSFTFTYKYYPSTGTGTGNMDGAGLFNASDAAATLTFPDFWGHGVQVIFREFTY